MLIKFGDNEVNQLNDVLDKDKRNKPNLCTSFMPTSLNYEPIK
jgi:hypothetical protein